MLERHGHAAPGVKVATYPFPAVDGLPKGVENPGAAAPGDAWRVDAAAFSETLMRPAHETLIRAQSPDAFVTDMQFLWNAASPTSSACRASGSASSAPSRPSPCATSRSLAASLPKPQGFPAPGIRIPTTELPEFLRSHKVADDSTTERFFAGQTDCFGLAVNTFSGLEQPYCDMYVPNGYVKCAYFLVLVSLQPSPPPPTAGDSSRWCIDWLDSKPDRSVVYLCFGSLAHVSDAQLHELALGLEASGKPFMWVVRAEKWNPPEGWKERVGDRGKLVTAWVPQTAILGHLAVAAFVTHCGWNSVLETVTAGVPVLTWPMVFEQFITERLLTEVIQIGERLWPDGAGVPSTRYAENEVIPAETVARALTEFMRPGGPGDTARGRVMALAAKARAAMAEGGSSHRDLHRLLGDLMDARGGQ